MTVRLEFKPRDCWIGVYWKVGPTAKRYSGATGECYYLQAVDVWICLVPMLPLHLRWMRGAVPEGATS